MIPAYPKHPHPHVVVKDVKRHDNYTFELLQGCWPAHGLPAKHFPTRRITTHDGVWIKHKEE